MILNKCECVLFRNKNEFWDCIKILDQNGYLFHHGQKLGTAASCYGVRFWGGGKFPNCIATMNESIRDSVRDTGYVYPAGANGDEPYRYKVLCYEEFMARVEGSSDVEVPSFDDLL